MLYHSAALSTGLGGITRLGFSRTSRTYRKGNPHLGLLPKLYKCERRECLVNLLLFNFNYLDCTIPFGVTGKGLEPIQLHISGGRVHS